MRKTEYMKSAYARISTACNASCTMCDFWQRPAHEMSEEAARYIVACIADLGFHEVILTGGEPLCAHGLPGVFKACRELKLKVSAITNGSMLLTALSGDDDLLPHRLFVSVDSPWSSTHDAIRGVACISAIEEWLATRPESVEVVVNTVVSKLNQKEVLDVPRWMHHNRISTINIIGMKSPSLGLGPQLNDLVVAVLLECDGYGIRHFVPGYPFGASCSETIECIRRPLPPDCRICDTCMFVETDGSVYPCNCSSYVGEQTQLGMLAEPCEFADHGATRHVTLDYARRPLPSFCAQRCDLSNRLFNCRALWHEEDLT